MSNDEEPFLARWSRLKRRGEPRPSEEDGKNASLQSDAGKPEEGARNDVAPAARQATGQPEQPLDLSKLPKIEELTADSDFAQFMDPRVPSSVRQAALRRAWTLDPRIRDFVEMSDWNYDWNVPGGAPCYAPLPAETKVAELLAQVFEGSSRNGVQQAGTAPAYDKLSQRTRDTAGGSPQVAGEDTAATAAAETETHSEKPYGASRVAEGEGTPVQSGKEPSLSTTDPPARRRRHGGALPA